MRPSSRPDPRAATPWALILCTALASCLEVKVEDAATDAAPPDAAAATEGEAASSNTSRVRFTSTPSEAASSSPSIIRFSRPAKSAIVPSASPSTPKVAQRVSGCS